MTHGFAIAVQRVKPRQPDRICVAVIHICSRLCIQAHTSLQACLQRQHVRGGPWSEEPWGPVSVLCSQCNGRFTREWHSELMRPASGSHVQLDAAVDSQDDGLAEASRHVSGTGTTGWKALSALAFEYTEAVRQTVSSDSGIGSTGSVHRESRAAPDVEIEDATDLETSSWPQPKAARRPGPHTPDDAVHVAAVQAEAARVAAKIPPLDLQADVVLRFDFITAHDSRVSWH